MPKTITLAQRKKHFFAYEKVYNTLRDLDYDRDLLLNEGERDALHTIYGKMKDMASGTAPASDHALRDVPAD